MYTTAFTITNLTCDACVKLSTMALKGLPGVTAIDIDQTTGHGTVHSTTPLAWGDIEQALASVKKEVIQRA